MIDYIVEMLKCYPNFSDMELLLQVVTLEQLAVLQLMPLVIHKPRMDRRLVITFQILDSADFF